MHFGAIENATNPHVPVTRTATKSSIRLNLELVQKPQTEINDELFDCASLRAWQFPKCDETA